MDAEKLELLHDHHKDSFAYIREREKQRDRLFLIVIFLFAALAVAVLASKQFGSVLGSVQFAGSQANLTVLPASAVLSALWVFTFVITLRYCQVCIAVERQYSYLHSLEETISRELGQNGAYQRESRAYTDNYPVFSTWAWISYVYVFPLLTTATAVGLVVTEWVQLPSGWVSKAIDTVIALATSLTLFLYRLLPLTSQWVGKRKPPKQPSADVS